MGSFLVSGCSVSGTTSLASDLTDLSQESRKRCGGSEAGVVVEKWVTFFRMCKNSCSKTMYCIYHRSTL